MDYTTVETERKVDRGDGFFKMEKRYVIVSTETGEILDDAQGYGYKSKQNAYRAYGWKQSKHHKKKRELTDEELELELYKEKMKWRQQK